LAAMLTAFLSLAIAASFSSVSQPWPGVRPFDRLFRVTDPSRAVLKAILEGSDGSPLYLFVCRTADDESVQGVIYAGDLDCRLMPAAQGEVEENLLVERKGLAAWPTSYREIVRHTPSTDESGTST
jgi:hypothetical protein